MEVIRTVKTLIISHGDCDGICSAAIALMKYQDANLAFAQPFTIVEDMKRAVRLFGKPDLLIILDIAYSKDMKIELEKMKDVEVVFIDHHPSSLKVSAPNIHTAVVNTSMSASQLTAEYFGGSIILAQIGAIGDKVLMVSKVDPLFNEAELIRKSLAYDVNDNNFRAFLCRKLTEGRMPSEISEVIFRAGEMEKAMNDAVEVAKDNIIFESEKAVVIRHPGDIHGYAGATASKIAIEMKKVVFLLFRVDTQPDVIMVTARAHRDINVDLNKVMNKIRGGGHKYAAAGRIPVGREDMVVKLAEDL